MAAKRKVDNRKSRVTERDSALRFAPAAAIVRSAVSESAHHPIYNRIVPRISLTVYEPADSAHR